MLPGKPTRTARLTAMWHGWENTPATGSSIAGSSLPTSRLAGVLVASCRCSAPTASFWRASLAVHTLGLRRILEHADLHDDQWEQRQH